MSVLNGWKTYAVAILTILYAAMGCALGQVDAATAIEMIFGAAGLGALRHGVSTTSLALAEKVALTVANGLTAAPAAGTSPGVGPKS